MDDDFFRMAMMVGLALVVPIAGYYRARSNSTGESLDRKQEGIFILIGIRLFALAHFFAIFAYLWDPATVAWALMYLPMWLRVSGVFLAALSSMLWIWTFHHLGKNLTDTVVTRKEHSLVMSGPYAYVRHPFYVAMTMLLLANTLVTANWFIGLSGILTMTFIYLRTAKEERKLVERFGEAYRAYMQKTGRFFPKLMA